MSISNDQLLDLVRTTLENLPNNEFETTLSKQNYIAINHWFQKDKVQEESGTSISRRIMLDNSGNARHVRLFQKSSVNVPQVLRPLTAPWVQIEGSYAIERREGLRNRKPAKLIDLVTVRRRDAALAMADQLESRAWKAPTDVNDDLLPRGLPYYLSKLLPSGGSGYSATIDKAGDFSGRRIIFGDGTTATNDKSGINPTTESKWRNFVDTIDGINASTVKKLTNAFYATRFVSPMLASDLKKGPASTFRIYMNRADIVEYDDLARKANDNLGADLAKFHGVSAFNRVPVLYAPELDADADGVIYGVNHDKFFPIVQEGDWNRESQPLIDPELHNVIQVFVDGSYQYFCTNVREAGFVLHRPLAA